MSLRRRLLLAVLATVLAALAILGALTYTLVARSQLDQVDADLERVHPPIEEAADGDAETRLRDIRDAAPGFYAELRDESGQSLLVVPLRDRDGDVITLEGDDLPAPAVTGGDDDAVFASIDLGDDELIRVRVSRQEDGSLLVIGRSLEELLHTRRRLLGALLVTGIGAVIAATALGAWLVRVGLRPLRDVERAAAGIDDDDLARRVPGDDESTEVGQLAHSINHMLERLEDAFSQRERDLAAVQESEARMRQFVADASHELRTPIAATAAYAELFERGARDRPDDLARAGIRNETSRMTELVDDLLLLARLDEGRPIAHGAVDLCEVVTAAADAARLVDPDRHVAVRLEDIAIVEGDESRLRQVIDNLLGNVRTHTPAGTPCQVVVAVDGDEAVLTVSDAGPGMSPADAARAFDRFHRADTSRTRASGGSGLGLSIVAAIVAAHDGSVDMESEPGVGTAVRVRLPLAVSAQAVETSGDPGGEQRDARRFDEQHIDEQHVDQREERS
jgi:two-component system OmpR family sensor kinase